MRIYGVVMLIFAMLLMVRRIAILMVTGWRLITKGRGITQRRRSSVSGAGAKPGAVSELESPTVELPVTPTVSAVMAREMARRWRITRIVILCSMSFFLLVGGGVGLAVSSPSGVKMFPYLAAASLAFGLFIGGIWMLASRPLRRDLAGFTYLRTSGPVQLVGLYGGYLLRLADRAFGLNAQEVVAALRNLTWASVDYSPHAHVIFEVRDRSGRSVYRPV